MKEACRQDLGRYVHLHSLRAIRLPRFSLLLIPDQDVLTFQEIRLQAHNQPVYFHGESVLPVEMQALPAIIVLGLH